VEGDFTNYPSILTIVYCDCTDLVQSGSILGSTVGTGMFSKLVSSMIHIPPYIYGVIVGLILGDAWIHFASKAHKNARLGFQQSLIHFPYFWSVFTILSPYCSSLPHLKYGTRKGNRFFGVTLQTRSLPCFTQIYSPFYIDGLKVIPVILIYDLLTPIALAHWICCDGSTKRSGLVICTDYYTIQEVVLLMNVLMIKYRLECTLIYHSPNNTHPRIYIRQRSMPLLRTIVFPYMNPSMLNKIHA
jgi:hypothetical protein